MYSAQKELDVLKKVYGEQEIPENIKNEIFTRYSLEEHLLVRKLRRKKQIKGFLVTIALLAVTTSSLLFSDQARSFAEDLPIIGPTVRLLLGEQLSDKGITIDVPQVTTSESEENETISGLNKKYFREGKVEFEKAKMEYQDIEKGHFQVTGDYRKVLDDMRFLVVERNLTKTAADSYTEKRYDTIDKQNSVVLSLPLLFKDDQYISTLTKEVKQQMSEQVKENPEKYYWTNKDFQEGVEEIPLVTKDTSFYINKNHELVLVYDQFAIAPGYMGNPEFVIPKAITSKLLATSDYLDR